MPWYTEEEARRLVIETGLRMKRCGLIERTWGNVSARIGETEFVITPTGRPYESLSAEELPVVNMLTMEHRGRLEPSSEQYLHAAAYRLNPGTSFIVHTHQTNATAVAAAMKDIAEAPCAPYAPPGTKELAVAAEACFRAHPDRKTFLLARHGAVFLAESPEEIFRLSESLEQTCRLLTGGKKKRTRRAYLDDYAQICGFGLRKPSADAEAYGLIREKNAMAAAYAASTGPMSLCETAKLRLFYRKNYEKRKDVNH